MSKLLEVSNLHVTFSTYAGDAHSVRGASFHVNKGEILAIVGESGCGKSVTAKTIMGLIPMPPASIDKDSKILFEDRDLLELTEEKLEKFRGKECSMIFQDALTSLNPTMKIGKQIYEKILLHEDVTIEEAKKRAIHLLELVGINNAEQRMNQYPHEFSGGMRQRVMIAIAIACNPNLIIADEPTTALDVTIQAEIMDIFKKMRDELGISIILITHDLGVVAGVADRIIVMYSGQIVETGDRKEIFYDSKHPYTKALIQAVPRLDIDERKHLFSIKGMPPNLLNPPIGCSFASRCKFCMKICEEMEPSRYEFSNSQSTLCWLYHPLAKEQIKKFNGGSNNV